MTALHTTPPSSHARPHPPPHSPKVLPSPQTSVSLNVFLPAEAAAVAGGVLATPLTSLTTPRVSTSNHASSSEGTLHQVDPLTLHLALARVMSVVHGGDDDEAGDGADMRLGSHLARELCQKVYTSRYAPLNFGDKVG